MKQFRIECEECESVAEVFTYDNPEFCPCCGRRADIEKRSDVANHLELLFEDE